MNDKLQDLMYQAGLTAQGCWDEMDSYDHEAIEKFAELIVRECAKVVSAMPNPYADDEMNHILGDNWDVACVTGFKQVKLHFGVDLPPVSLRQVTIEEAIMASDQHDAY